MFFVFIFSTKGFIYQNLVKHFHLKVKLKVCFIFLGSLVAEKSQYWKSTNSENDENWFYSIKNVYTQKQDDQIVVKDLFVVDVHTGDIRTKREINYTLDCANNCFCIVNILVSFLNSFQ